MDADYFRLSFEFSCWARDRLFEAAGKISDDEWRREGDWTYKSIGGMLLHAMQAERLLATRMMGAVPAVPPANAELPTAADMLATWKQDEATLKGWLASLNDADLLKLHATRTGETEVWKTLTHMGYHSMQHRAEAAEALTMAGSSPGNLDYIIFMAERG